MYERILQQFRDRIRSLDYVVMLYADEQWMKTASRFLTWSAVLTREIVERQRDRLTREWKYVVNGRGVDRSTVGTVGKLSITGCLVIITVYRVQP